MLKRSKGSAAYFCVLHFSFTAGRKGQSRTTKDNQIKACRALKRQHFSASWIKYSYPSWCLERNEFEAVGPRGAMCNVFLTRVIYDGVQAEWHVLLCQAELRSDSIEKEQSP